MTSIREIVLLEKDYYVGMTSRNFYKIAEQAGRSFRTNSLLSHPPHSAIRDHTFGCNSPISINQFKIIDSTSNQLDLKIIESLHILSIKPSLNNANTVVPILCKLLLKYFVIFFNTVLYLFKLGYSFT